MATGNPMRLLSLADREFRQLTGKPIAIEPDKKFKPMKRKRSVIPSCTRISEFSAG